MNTQTSRTLPTDQRADSESFRRKFAAGALVAVGTLIVLGLWVLSALPSTQIGWDFPVFYIAGRLPLDHLYSRAAFAGFFHDHLAPLGVPHWAPYVRPSVFSLLLRPIASLPYFQAWWLWLGAGLTAYFASITLLMRRFRLPGLLLPAYAGFFPAIVGIVSGADVGFLLFALVLAFIFLERRRDVLAGLALTACLCKFNLVFLIPLLLLLHRRYRALAAFAIGAGSVAVASMSLTRLGDYLHAVADAQAKTPGFFPVGLHGFSVAIGQPWCYPILAAAAAVLCCWLMKGLPFTEAFSVAIIGALLISPYVCWYDSTLMVLPVALILGRSTMPIRVSCFAALVALPLWQQGGGNNGPIGFMHVGVEFFLLAYFMSLAAPLHWNFMWGRAIGVGARET